MTRATRRHTYGYVTRCRIDVSREMSRRCRIGVVRCRKMSYYVNYTSHYVTLKVDQHVDMCVTYVHVPIRTGRARGAWAGVPVQRCQQYSIHMVQYGIPGKVTVVAGRRYRTVPCTVWCAYMYTPVPRPRHRVRTKIGIQLYTYILALMHQTCTQSINRWSTED